VHLALSREIVTAYTLARNVLNAEMTETRRLDHKAKKRQQTSFHSGFRHTQRHRHHAHTGRQVLRFQAQLQAPEAAPWAAAPGDKQGSTGTFRGGWGEEVG